MNRKEREMTTPLQKAIEGLTTAKIQFSNADDASYVWVSKSQVLEIIRQHESQQAVDEEKMKLAKQRLDWLVCDCGDENHKWAFNYLLSHLRTSHPKVELDSRLLWHSHSSTFVTKVSHYEFEEIIKAAFSKAGVKLCLKK